MQKLDEYIRGFEAYYIQIIGLAEKSVKAYSRATSVFLDWFENEKPKTSSTAPTTVADITTEDVLSYLEHLWFKGNKPRTRVTKLVALRNFFNYLKKFHIVPENIMVDIPNPKIGQQMMPEFTKKEILKIFKAIDPKTAKGQRDIVIFILAAFCGLRVSEITHLNMTDIIDAETDTGMIVLVGNKKFTPKQGSHRKVDIWTAPADKIRQWIALRQSHDNVRKDSPLLITFTRGDHPCPEKRPSSVDLSNLINKYTAEAKINNPESRMHMFRASHASALRYIEGYDMCSAAKRLGHVGIETTARYVQEWGRVKKKDIRTSLAAYWHEFKHLWDEKEGGQETI